MLKKFHFVLKHSFYNFSLLALPWSFIWSSCIVGCIVLELCETFYIELITNYLYDPVYLDFESAKLNGQRQEPQTGFEPRG